MNKLFDNMLCAEESLFLNPEHLDFDYQPKLIKHREKEQYYLASCIKPLFHNRNGKNVLIFGLPGIGKTISSKKVLQELEEHEDKISLIYINCWKKDTPHKMALDICSQLNYTWTLNKSTDDLLYEISSILNKKSAVFIFDEFDKAKDLDILYSILEDIYKKTILLITNEKDKIILDARLKSRLILEELEFKPYSLQQVKDILQQRVDYAFVKNVLSKKAFNLIVEKTFNLKDLRTGLFLLKESGNIAEDLSSREITLEHAKKAIEKLKNYKITSSATLEEEKQQLLSLIKENSGLAIKELYEIYKQKNNVSYKTFNRKLKELEKSRTINLVEGTSEKGGKTLIVEYGTKKLSDF